MAYDNERDEHTDFRRRMALRSLGMGALTALAGSALAGGAQAASAWGGAAAATVDSSLPPTVQLLKLQSAQLLALKLTARLPNSTPISGLGLDDSAISQLTPAAKGLTKSDLLALGQGDLGGSRGSLTVSDIASIRNAFGNNYSPMMLKSKGLADSVSCCCCTPCCCAAAVREPMALAA